MTPQYFLVLAVVIIMGWFAFGVIFNLRRGDAILRWMQEGLPRVGPKTTFRWLGTSVAELVIAKAKKPFRRLEILLVLAPRDVFWMVIAAALQGRRDTTIFRAHLGVSPLLDLELADPKTWTGRTTLKQLASRGWESQPYQDMQLMAPRGLLDLAAHTLEAHRSAREKFSTRYMRISLRKDAPHLEVHVPFPDHRTMDAATYFDDLAALARAVTERDV